MLGEFNGQTGLQEQRLYLSSRELLVLPFNKWHMWAHLLAVGHSPMAVNLGVRMTLVVPLTVLALVQFIVYSAIVNLLENKPFSFQLSVFWVKLHFEYQSVFCPILPDRQF